MEMPEGAELVFEWEYDDQTKKPHGEKIYKLPNGQFAREQWTRGEKHSDWVPCSPERLVEILRAMKHTFPHDYCAYCSADNGPIWPGATYGEDRVGHVCCSCMCC